jgi:hypothetical protein
MEMQVYVKSTSNCDGLPLTTFEVLSPIWTGESIRIPFGPEGVEHDVIGWTDLFFGSPAPVHVARVSHRGREGYLIWGGNSGVRVLDDQAEPVPGVDDHLPRGWGQPIIWVEDPDDLPADVRAVVEP